MSFYEIHRMFFAPLMVHASAEHQATIVQLKAIREQIVAGLQPGATEQRMLTPWRPASRVSADQMRAHPIVTAAEEDGYVRHWRDMEERRLREAAFNERAAAEARARVDDLDGAAESDVAAPVAAPGPAKKQKLSTLDDYFKKKQ